MMHQWRDPPNHLSSLTLMRCSHTVWPYIKDCKGVVSQCLAVAYVIDTPADAQNLWWLILQPTSANGSESSIFDSSADIGWKQRCAEVPEGVRKFRSESILQFRSMAFKQAQEHSNWSRNKGDIIRTYLTTCLTISPSVLGWFGCCWACSKVAGKSDYPWIRLDLR